MSHFPTTEPHPPGPAEGLRNQASTLREHAHRLINATADLNWHGPQADAFRNHVNELAQRCRTAAEGLALSATHLENQPGRP